MSSLNNKLLLETALKLAHDVENESFLYDDPNGPYRCWVCSEPKGHTEDCIVSKARNLITLFEE